jgi:hypothetical protein
MFVTIAIGFLFLTYLTFIILLYIGGGFITNAVFKKSEAQLSNVGLDNSDQIHIAQMTMVIFWIFFIPLSILPVLLMLKYGKYIG